MSTEEDKQAVNVMALRRERDSLAARLKEFQSLCAEILSFFHAQTFASSPPTEKVVSQAFTDILLRHWDLCCIVTYLRAGEEESLRLDHLKLDPHVDPTAAHRASALLAAAVEGTGLEQQVWLGPEEAGEKVEVELAGAFAAAGLRAGVGVPIYSGNKTLAGILVVTTAFPAQLRQALDGVRLIAEPMIIAISNTHRAQVLREQRGQIEQLVSELKEANRELQRNSLYRSLFLARMSHELRTPLTSILGFAEILLDQEKLTGTQRRFCEKIQSSGLQLQTSLKQLVDLSRLEAGQMEMFLHEFSLRETLRESCAAVTPLARKREIAVDCQAGLDLPSIVSDEGKLRQVLYNFLAYAINRSPARGRVVVRADFVLPCRFEITINDEGEPVDEITKIFEPVNIEVPGGGATNLNELGLSIARRLIEVLRGTVRLESASPQGLLVHISLPARPTAE